MALRYLRAKNIRYCSVMTLFSIIGITIGVATLIIVMSVMNGFKAELIDFVLGTNGHINVYFDRNINPNYKAVSQLIERMPGVLEAIPMTSDQVIIEANGNIAVAMVKGIEKPIIKDNIIAGNVENFDTGIMIGAHLAELLGVYYGDKVTFVFPEVFLGEIPKMQQYEIVGVFDTGKFEHNNILIYMPLKNAQDFFGYKESNIRNIEVLISAVDQSDRLAKIIEETVQMKSESWQSQYSGHFHAFNKEKNVMFLILTLIIVVAAFNIISNLMIIIHTKKSAIAIMRTFGSTSGSIMRIFCICGLLIGFVGTCIGCIIGVIFSLNIENFKIFLENAQLCSSITHFLSDLPVILVTNEVVNIAVMTMSLSFLAAIIPALQAAKQDPAEILRYE
jgi:lipoprotein-releasing system permease protein